MTKLASMYNEKNSLIDNIGYIIMYLMVGLIPHIYKYVPFSVSESESVYFKEPVYADLYMLAKGRLFLILTVLLLCIFIYQLWKNKIKFIKDKITAGTVLFAVIVVVSSVMSEYQDLVYWGSKDRFEGMWVWIAYLVVFTVARHYGSNKIFTDKMLKVFVFSASIMAVFGLMQINGYDIYTEGPLRWVCFPREIASNMSLYMTSNTSDILAVGAMFNSNYFGVYSAMAAIAGIVLYLRSAASSRYIYGAMTILTYGAVIASRAEAALLGFSLALVVVVISYGDEFWVSKKDTGLLLIGIVISDRFVVGMLKGNQSENALYIYILMVMVILIGMVIKVLLNRNNRFQMMIRRHSVILGMITFAIVIVGFNLFYRMLPISNNSNLIELLSIQENELHLKMEDDESLIFVFLPIGISTYGEGGREIVAEQLAENVITLKSINREYNMKFKMYSNGYLATLNSPIEFNVFYNGQTIQYVDKISGIGELQNPSRFMYYGDNSSAFTKRGYIWGTYMPIMKEHILVGSGLDTYANIFPQNDYMGKHNAYTGNYSDIIVDKPHSTYLMLGLSMGVVALVLFCLFISSILERYYSFITNSNIQNGMVALMVVVFIAGIFNDSIIPMSILMFCFGGSVLSLKESVEEL